MKALSVPGERGAAKTAAKKGAMRARGRRGKAARDTPSPATPLPYCTGRECPRSVLSAQRTGTLPCAMLGDQQAQRRQVEDLAALSGVLSRSRVESRSPRRTGKRGMENERVGSLGEREGTALMSALPPRLASGVRTHGHRFLSQSVA